VTDVFGPIGIGQGSSNRVSFIGAHSVSSAKKKDCKYDKRKGGKKIQTPGFQAPFPAAGAIHGFWELM
jgi:hypothetical protein